MGKTTSHHGWVFWALMAAAAWGLTPRQPVLKSVVATDLACHDTLYITLNGNCQATLTADQLLEGSLGCLKATDLDIRIFDGRPENGPVLDGHGLFRYEVSLKPGAGCPESSFSSCWGYIRGEDKTGPVVTCPPDSRQITRQWNLQRLAGSINDGDPTLDLGKTLCLSGGGPVPAQPVPYELFRFRVSQRAIYTFELKSSAPAPIAALYFDEFNLLNSCKRLIEVAAPVNDGSGYFPATPGILRLSLQLLPGREYILFTGSSESNSAGDYLWAVYTSGNGQIEGIPQSRQPVVLPLFCDNIDSILNRQSSLDYLGRATARDNCSSPESLGFIDRVIEGGECSDKVIGRTFGFRDKARNPGSCTQRITVRQPGLQDVVLPPYQMFIHCDENIMVDEKGNPHPSVSGRPFLPTAFGPIFLDTVRCGLGAFYRDEAVLDKCTNTRLIHRVWTVVDWCRGETKKVLSQDIQVGDFQGPQFDCPTTPKGEPLTFSAGPFSCFASFTAPRPVNLRDNCSPTIALTIKILLDGKKEFLTLGPDATSLEVTGLPIGNHIFRYLARDECGNETVRDCPFRVVDGVAPVAICNDQLNISLGGDGRSSVKATDVDEGSWDNCDPNPKLTVRRVVPLECLQTYRSEIDTFVTLDKASGLYYTPWREEVKFICCDIGSKVRIELRATDAGGLSNICWLETPVEDKIPPRCTAPHDRSLPCDSLTYLNWSDTLDLQEFFGRATAADNCSATIVELEPQLKTDACGVGELIRRFQAVDGSGNRSSICQQRIVLTARNEYGVRFPRDIESRSCDLPPGDTLQLQVLGCDLLAINRDTNYFEAVADECFQMYIRYRVINWCEYDGATEKPTLIPRDLDGDNFTREFTHLDAGYLSLDSLQRNYPLCGDDWARIDGLDGDGRRRQIFVVRLFSEDNKGKKNALPDKILVRGNCSKRSDKVGFVVFRLKKTNDPKQPVCYEPYCEEKSVSALCAQAAYLDQCWTPGYFEYTQIVSVYDNTAPEIIVAPSQNIFCALNDRCSAQVDILFEIQDSCIAGEFEYELEIEDTSGRMDLDVEIFIKGRFPKQRISGEFDIGKYTFYLRVADGCGNFTTRAINVEVVDCKAPAPICIQRIAAELMPFDDNGDGIVDRAANTIPAEAFIISPSFDCSGVRYSVNRVGQRPHPDSTSITVTCQDPEILPVEVYAWDSVFNPIFIQPDGTIGGPNYSFCSALIFVQDNQFNWCNRPGGPASVAGLIATDDGRTVAGVDVSLSGESSSNFFTGSGGRYLFINLREGHDYSITPRFDSDPLNGVSTFDLVRISKHILGLEPLNTPYQLIAADVNRSGSITAIDLIQARKLILGTDLRFPNNTSWRFIPAGHRFTNPANPWQGGLPEVANINDYSAGHPDIDFIAVKVGDVNSNAKGNAFAPVQPRASAGPFLLHTPERELVAGEEYEVALSAVQLMTIQGLQFTLGWDQERLQLLDRQPGLLQDEETALFEREGLLTASWINPQFVAENPWSLNDSTLFSLRFRALRSGKLSQALEINSRRTAAEAYDPQNRLLDPQLHFEQPPQTEDLLYTNRPNPFRSHTLLPFFLAAAGEVEIEIHDAAGRLLYQRRFQAPAGYQEMELETSHAKSLLPASGLLFWTLKTERGKKVGKMVRMAP